MEKKDPVNHEEENMSNIIRHLLRVEYPRLYETLMKELAKHHIHPFDVAAACREGDDKVEILVQYGQGFAHKKAYTLSKEELNDDLEEYRNFCKEVAEICKETMIADYFNIVNP